MAAKKGSSGGSKVVNALAGAAATFVARKVLVVAWKKITGKEPPEHPEDPQVALSEALIWGIVRRRRREHRQAAGNEGSLRPSAQGLRQS